MKISKISIQNFRGISSGEIIFPSSTAVLIGDNNVGKSTILEALDLVLGPERLSRHPIIDEHDFYAGRYFDDDSNNIQIKIEVIVTGLTTEQEANFNANLEWWDYELKALVDQTAGSNISSALRICFIGEYDGDEDDFIGGTYFSHPLLTDNSLTRFGKSEKRECGFLYLRALRTGSRALSLERGSLLDIILKLKEIRPKMWENVLNSLRDMSVAASPEVGLKGVFTSLQDSIKKFVPAEWGSEPHLKVSDLTRDNLRHVLTAFISSGAGNHAAPFQHQGTGTINMLVLALLSMIAEEKKNVIFAMEEPEIAIPPYAQKRIIDIVCKMSSQALFTSHSPFVIEEFDPENVLVLKRDTNGNLLGKSITLPASIKFKRYRQDFRGKFAESLLARRVFIAEGATEATAIPTAARKLSHDNPEIYSSLESLGLAICDAATENQVASFGKFFKDLGKTTFAFYDLQSEEDQSEIVDSVDYCYMSPSKGTEKLVVDYSSADALKRYLSLIISESIWPTHLSIKNPTPLANEATTKKAIFDYFKDDKGDGRVADFLAQCAENEMPEFILRTLKDIKLQVVLQGAIK